MFTICSETNDLGSPKNCDLIQGFHINKEGMIDSGIGIPIGQKLSLKAFVNIEDPNGGFVTIEYKNLNFDKNEIFRISIDG